MSETKAASAPLLTPYKMGPFNLAHRVVLAPLARQRSYNTIPQPHAILYYSQRTTRGGLLITEATGISDTAQGLPDTRYAWDMDRGAGSSVEAHRESCTRQNYQPDGQSPVSSTSKPISGKIPLPNRKDVADFSPPRPLKAEEIPNIVAHFRNAARNAIDAGFDGVEIHGAHGFLLDHFMKDSVNDRTDCYGGTLENRCRFALQVVEAVVDEIGAGRVGIQLSPFSAHFDAYDSNPEAPGIYMAAAITKYKILYAHFVEPRILNSEKTIASEKSLIPMSKAFKGTFLAAVGYDRDDGNEAISSGKADLIVYGRLFLANPDLPKGFELKAHLNTTEKHSIPLILSLDTPIIHSSNHHTDINLVIVLKSI